MRNSRGSEFFQQLLNGSSGNCFRDDSRCGRKGKYIKEGFIKIQWPALLKGFLIYYETVPLQRSSRRPQDGLLKDHNRTKLIMMAASPSDDQSLDTLTIRPTLNSQRFNFSTENYCCFTLAPATSQRNWLNNRYRPHESIFGIEGDRIASLIFMQNKISLRSSRYHSQWICIDQSLQSNLYGEKIWRRNKKPENCRRYMTCRTRTENKTHKFI